MSYFEMIIIFLTKFNKIEIFSWFQRATFGIMFFSNFVPKVALWNEGNYGRCHSHESGNPELSNYHK